MEINNFSLKESRNDCLSKAKLALKIGLCMEEEYEAFETVAKQLSNEKLIENLYHWWTDYIVHDDPEKRKIVTDMNKELKLKFFEKTLEREVIEEELDEIKNEIKGTTW